MRMRRFFDFILIFRLKTRISKGYKLVTFGWLHKFPVKKSTLKHATRAWKFIPFFMAIFMKASGTRGSFLKRIRIFRKTAPNLPLFQTDRSNSLCFFIERHCCRNSIKFLQILSFASGLTRRIGVRIIQRHRNSFSN